MKSARLNIVLRALTDAKGEVVPVAALNSALYAKRQRCASSVKVAVCHLRKHLVGTHEIQSVRSRGYRLVELIT
jgi:DNA-binding response OmpR family regulator